MFQPSRKVKVELDLGIVFNVEGQDTSKETAGKGAVNQPRGNPSICPKCQKGAHWANDCHSKTDSQGNLIPRSKNGGRGLPRAPKTQVYGAMSGAAAPITFIPQRNASLSTTLYEAPQEA